MIPMIPIIINILHDLNQINEMHLIKGVAVQRNEITELHKNL